MYDTVGRYLDEIGESSLLTAEEERELAQVIERGREARRRLDEGERGSHLYKSVRKGTEAKERFIRSNLRLVVSIARRYPKNGGMEFLDLIQEGNLGLEHAVDKFDWRKGFKFSTYATYWIRQAIGRALSQKTSLIRLPGDKMDNLRAALRNTGDETVLTEDQAHLYSLANPASLDMELHDDGKLTLSDITPDVAPMPDETIETEMTNETVRYLLVGLKGNTRLIVEKRLGFYDGSEHSFAEIGEELDISGEAVRRTFNRGIKTLRKQIAELDFDELDLSAA